MLLFDPTIATLTVTVVKARGLMYKDISTGKLSASRKTRRNEVLIVYQST